MSNSFENPKSEAPSRHNREKIETFLGKFDNDNYSEADVKEIRILPQTIKDLIDNGEVTSEVIARLVHRFLDTAGRVRTMFPKESSVVTELNAAEQDLHRLVREEYPGGLRTEERQQDARAAEEEHSAEILDFKQRSH